MTIQVNDQVARLLTAVTANGVGDVFVFPRNSPQRVFQANIAGSGAVSATVTVEGSCDGVNWIPAIATMSLSGAGGADTKTGNTPDSPWPMMRGRVASLTGTNAAVDLYCGI